MVKYDFTDFLLKVEEISQVGLKYSTDSYALDNYYELSKLTKDYISNIDKIQKEDLNVFKKDVYPTPNVSVRTIFLSEDKKKVFLVREAVDGGWSFPGGWTEIGLSPMESAKKEVWEEAGSDCDITRMIGAMDRYSGLRTTGTPEYILVYQGVFKGEKHKPTYEILETGWFPINDLPEISKKNVRAQMDRMIKCAVEGTSLLD
jgi:8-oxo-dGTP diphosphatase